MCGIIGMAGPGSEVPEAQITKMLESIHHRGPDGRGHAEGEGWFLGHTRLAIQDTRALAGQPYQAGNVTLTYNGELWHPDEYSVGPRDTTGDTEVVAKALDLWGPSAVTYFDGMWAMAWYDARDGMIRLARDRWGKVPLYWATDGSTVYWASEYHALPSGLEGQAVEPGTTITINPPLAGFDQTVTRWAVDNPIVPYAAEPEQVRYLLRQGVKERLVGDRSIAFMLSGGLDSSLILTLAHELYQGEIVAYTAVLDPDSRDLRSARYMAKTLGVELVEVPVPEPTFETVKAAVECIEIPMKAQVEIALAHMPVMEQVAKDGHAVCLSGEAADELFGGYGGMQIKASKADDDGYREIKLDAITKMARGNFPRVNKVGMRYGVECRLPFMQADLVELAIQATKAESPPGKKLLKQAAKDFVPDQIINRPKETFQGSTGTAERAAHLGGIRHYNHLARTRFGYIPKD